MAAATLRCTCPCRRTDLPVDEGVGRPRVTALFARPLADPTDDDVREITDAHPAPARLAGVLPH